MVKAAGYAGNDYRTSWHSVIKQSASFLFLSHYNMVYNRKGMQCFYSRYIERETFLVKSGSIVRLYRKGLNLRAKHLRITLCTTSKGMS